MNTTNSRLGSTESDKTNDKTKAPLGEGEVSVVLSNLGVKAKAQRVLVYLMGHGISAVNKIAYGLNMPKSSVYDAVSELLEKSLIVEYNTGSGKEYEVVGKDQLLRLNEEKIKKLQKEQRLLADLLDSTVKLESSPKPKIKFYMGAEGVKQAFRDTMWHDKCKVSYLMWPTKDMFKTMGLDFTIWHTRARLTHNVFLYCIQRESDKDFAETVPEAPILLAEESWIKNCETRIAPNNVDWKMSFWIYDNKCLFNSGGDEKIAFLIDSKEFCDLMLALWKQMWEVSSLR